MSDIDMPRVKPDFEGFLTKRSVWLKEWRKRYFRLIGDKLYFSKTAAYEPHGVIDLKNCLSVKSAEEKTGRPHCFELATPEQTYFLCAENDGEKDEWIGVIGKGLVTSSRSFRRHEAGLEDEGDSDDDDDDDDEEEEAPATRRIGY